MFLALGLAAICAIYYYYVIYLRRPQSPGQKLPPPLPPGPPALPIIGHLHLLPKEHIWHQFKKWHDQYGPIICIKFGSLKIVSLGSYHVVHDLLEKRSSNTARVPSSWLIELATAFFRLSYPLKINGRRTIACILHCSRSRPVSSIRWSRMLKASR